MKKSNLVLFILSFCIILSGLFSSDFINGAKELMSRFALQTQNFGLVSAFEDFTKGAETLTTERLSYRNLLVDTSSVYMRLMNTKVVEKSDSTVVRTNSGYLANPRGRIPLSQIEEGAKKVKELMLSTEDNGSKFLYVIAPSKGGQLKFPPNVTDYTEENCNNLISSLEKHNVSVLNLIDAKESQGITDEEMFFATDHHWRPQYGLWAVGEIFGELERRYGFSYDKSVTELSSYNTKTLENWFLGSQGKKVGSFFAKDAVDDIDIITPKFETSLKEIQPMKNSIREGSFENTVMYMGNAEKRDLYTLNPYASYSGGDFREQIIENNLNADGKKILLIRDSFGCAVMPFMSLGVSSLHVVDVRDGEYYIGEKVNVFEYIKETDPDYVVVLYNGMSDNKSLYDFR